MLLVHRSERADYLVEALGDLLLDALDDPMTAEIVAVPTRGVERWLTQRLSHRLGAGPGAGDGICANVQFPFPGSLVREATSIACGFDAETDPWPPERSVWPLIELVDAELCEPYLAPLAAHLRADTSERSGEEETLRRYATVRHLADLYDRYAVHRPDMVLRWAEALADPDGTERTGSAAECSAEGPGAWQAELWRHLRRRIGVPSPAERLETARARIADEPDLLDLPPRMSLFGLTRLPASHLRILDAIATNRDVHLFLLYPSGRLWEKVEQLASRLPHPIRRHVDPTAPTAANPLLRSWGRDAREMQLVLAAQGVSGGHHRPVPEQGGADLTVLQLLQADVRADRPPVGAPRPGADRDERPLLAPDDDSLRVHSCHGRLRQVEVMRDAILHLLADDPTLEPRDVVVMCPDIETFAPLIHAVFGSQNQPPSPAELDDGEEPEPGPPHVRVRLADRSIRQTNPILAVAAQLLDLASGRVTASEVLDLAGREPVCRRFRFDEDDLGQLERWVGETGIRWGLDREHRAPWKLEGVRENTWQAGLDRLLLGVAMAEEDERLFNGVLPLDDVSSGMVDLAGRFAELVERIQLAVARLQGPQTVSDWTKTLGDATESIAVASPHEQWQHDQLHRVLSDVAEAADSDGSNGAAGASASLLDLAEVRTLLGDRLRGRPTRANFRTGDLTICTLVPMRSVPHRVIGLLGLDDGAFPRHTAQDGDDLLLADPHVGDRDTRSEDRQLLLDALLAATEHLVVTYEGRDPRTNQERSPCVPIAELLDVVDRTVRIGEDPSSRARSKIVVEHPLQSFDQRNFCPGELRTEEAWSFDPVDLEGARSVAATPAERRPFLEHALDPVDTSVIQLDSLVRFLEHPVRAFLRERLGWYGTGGSDEVKDSLPVELDALEQWGVGDRMLAALLGGASLERAREAEHGRGLLPPGALADSTLADIETAVAGLAGVARSLSPIGRIAADSVEINVRLPDRRVLVGTVPDVYRSDGDPAVACIVRCLYSHLGQKHRLGAWARFLSLTAAHPEMTVTAVTIGRGTGTSKGAPRVDVVELPPLAGDVDERRALALGHLAVLADLYDRGMREPLPLFTKTSETYVDAILNERDWKAECRKVWESYGDHGFTEGVEPEHELVLGGRLRFDDLLAEAPREDESGPGWKAHRSRFGRLAVRLWEPVLLHEERSYPS
jgi:exodeoxyribonuclease V gamma subunit